MAAVGVSAALGADIYIGTGDFQFTGYGDIALCTQLDLVAQSLYLAALPDPGSVLLHPELGAGLASAVMSPLSQMAMDTLAARVADIAGSNPAVSQVVDVTVEQPTPRQAQVTATVQLVGGALVSLPLPLVTG